MKKLIKISDSLIITYAVKVAYLFLTLLSVLYLSEMLATDNFTDIIDYFVLIFAISIIFHLLRFCLLAKSVAHDNNYLYISSIWNTHKIKIGQIDRIKQSFIMKQTVPTHMMLVFMKSNMLCNKVIFIPNHEVFNSKNLLEEVRQSLSIGNS